MEQPVGKKDEDREDNACRFVGCFGNTSLCVHNSAD